MALNFPLLWWAVLWFPPFQLLQLFYVEQVRRHLGSSRLRFKKCHRIKYPASSGFSRPEFTLWREGNHCEQRFPLAIGLRWARFARGRSALKQEGLYQNKVNSSLVLNWVVTVHSTWLHDFTDHSAPISYPLIDALRLLLFAFVNGYYSFTIFRRFYWPKSPG